MRRTWYTLALVVAGGLTVLVAWEWAGIKRYIKIERMFWHA